MDRLRPISSRQNSLVKELRKAFSQAEPTKQGAMAIEGVRIIEEAIRSGLRFQAVFFSESGRTHAERLLPQISSHTETIVLPESVFASAVATETPQGVAALVMPKTTRLEDILESADNDALSDGQSQGASSAVQSNDALSAGQTNDALIIGLAAVQDPGNVGTVIRSAEAFSARAVLLGERTVSHFNSKVVRASAGSVFRQPVIRAALLDTVSMLKDHGFRAVATSSHKGQPLDQLNLRGRLLLLIGSEGAGLPPAITAQADELVTIPHSPRVESLNAGIAASILLYEAARQRREAVGS